MAAGSDSETATRALVYAGTAVAVAAGALLAWHALPYLLLVFMGVLLALLLRAPSDWLAAKTGLRSGIALILVGLGLLAVLAASGWFLGSAVAAQMLELGQRIPQVVDSILEQLRSREWGQRAIDHFSGGEQVDSAKVIGGALQFAGSALGVVTGLGIVVFFAVFFAAQPRLYVDGLVRLVPPRGRARAREVLESIGAVLQRWLVGQAILMLVIGVLGFIGLTLLGAPLALPLAIIAGLFNFVPYVGPIAAAVPAVLVGFSESAQMAGYVALFFLALQTVEGNVLEPLIQHRAVDMPPALILLAQILGGLLAGPPGIIVATPLGAAIMVAVRMLYVEDALEKS